MFFVSEIKTDAPERPSTPLQALTYQTLERLGIPFERVETEETITMEDCVQINAVLQMNMVKTLFLCNRQQTEYYLFVTEGDKPFRAKDFSAALGIARVSFAPPERMEALLGTKVGAATIFSALLPSAREVHVVLDRAVLAREWYGCSDGTTTGYLRIRTERILREILPASGHDAQLIEV